MKHGKEMANDSLYFLSHLHTFFVHLIGIDNRQPQRLCYSKIACCYAPVNVTLLKNWDKRNLCI